MLYLIPLLILCACSPEKKVDNHFVGDAMTMAYHIHVAHPITKKERSQIESLIDDTFSYADNTYNHWNENSEISQFNKLKAYEALLISNTLCDLFTLSSKLHTLTKGRFDPTLRPIIQSLKLNQQIPEISSTGWEQIKLQKKKL